MRFHISQSRQWTKRPEAAEFLVDLATHDDSGELDSLIEELALDEVFSENTRSARFRVGQPAPLSFFVGVDDWQSAAPTSGCSAMPLRNRS